MQLLPKTTPSLRVKLAVYLKRDVQFRRVYAQTKVHFVRANLVAHNWEYIDRDVLNAIVIGEAEKADMRIVLPATTMHDIGFLYGADGPTHEAIGALKLSHFLKRIRVDYPAAERTHIAACTRTHKGSAFGKVPNSLEAKVVCDADMLEKFGPFGVYQLIRTWAEFGFVIEETIDFGRRRHRDRTYQLNTKTGSRLAERGRRLPMGFFDALDRAYEPYR